MSSSSGIEWTKATWNPVVGCTRVSAGCDHCYAVPMTHRLEGAARGAVGLGQLRRKAQHYVGLTVLNGKGERHFNGVVRCVDEELPRPLRWKKPARIFVNSMSDLFHPAVPFDFIDKVFAVMALTPQHTYQILTKRPERMAEYTAQKNSHSGRWVIQSRMIDLSGDTTRGTLTADAPQGRDIPWPLPNVWLGTSVEDQAAADKRIPELLKCPAAVRFLSCEPLLGEIDLFCRYRDGASCNVLKLADISPGAPSGGRAIHWVIVGGESGKGGARPCNIEWVRSIVGQCVAAGVPVFVKQLGHWIAGLHDFDGWKGVIDRWLLHDGKRSGVCKRPILESRYHPHLFNERPQNAIAWGLNDTKGGNPAEWPADLRVREFPREAKT